MLERLLLDEFGRLLQECVIQVSNGDSNIRATLCVNIWQKLLVDGSIKRKSCR